MESNLGGGMDLSLSKSTMDEQGEPLPLNMMMETKDDESSDEDDDESALLQSLNILEPSEKSRNPSSTVNGSKASKGDRLDAIVQQALARAQSIPTGSTSSASSKKQKAKNQSKPPVPKSRGRKLSKDSKSKSQPTKRQAVKPNRSDIVQNFVPQIEKMGDAHKQKIIQGTNYGAGQGVASARAPSAGPLPLVPQPVKYDSMEMKRLEEVPNPNFTEPLSVPKESQGEKDEWKESEDEESMDEEDEVSTEEESDANQSDQDECDDDDDINEKDVKELAEAASTCEDLPMPILTLESELDLGESIDREKNVETADVDDSEVAEAESWPAECLADERPPTDADEEEDDEDDDGEDEDESAEEPEELKGEESEDEKKSKKRKKKSSDKPKKKRKRRDSNEEETQKKKKKKRKKKSKEECEEDSDDDFESGKKRKSAFERRNIRKIMEDGNLEAETIDAQREEAERKARLLEKLQQQAQELRRQRDLERQQNVAEAEEVARKAMDELKNMQLKSLLEADDEPPESPGKIPALKPSKPAAEDIVEISSSDDENEIVLMPPEEPSDEEEEDPTSSGSHTNDALNQPDAHGNVLVNVGHPADEPDIFLAPQLARTVKAHQIGGIRFLYDNLVESQDRFRTSNGFGCILAHSMGLGKTLQLISFMDVFLRNTEAKTVLCIVPVNTLQNWVSEFNMWLPTAKDLREKFMPDVAPDVQVREFGLFVVNDNQKSNTARAAVVTKWRKEGGVLLMGYEMYRLLTSKKVLVKPSRKSKKKAPQPPPVASNAPVVIDLEEEDKNKELLRELHEALMRPGPDLVVCDEGHRIKNSHASISQALKNIRTKRRVVLTGYPLQNNLLEYWCMVDFVRPNYLGSKTEFCNMFERPIMNGQCQDSTPQDIRLMRFRAHVLHSLLEGFVQRRGHTVLQLALPTKEEFVLLVRMSPIQRMLYSKFMVSMTETGLQNWASNNPLKAFSVCCKIWNHPDILNRIVQQQKVDDNDLDLEGPMEGDEGKGKKGKGKAAKNQIQSPAQSAASSPNPSDLNSRPPSSVPPDSDSQPPANPGLFNDKKDQMITFEWAESMLNDYKEGLLEHGGKMLILMDLVRRTILHGDKLLIFSQSLFTLNLIEEFLGREYIPGREETWQKNRSYFRLDGSTSGLDREKLINQFNAEDNNQVHLFLLSTRAGCLGINLIGANRVVIFDASWNPCHDCQAVCRVYRYGQMKPCYVYRLVTDNTLEKKIYDRQINKQGMSDRVVDELNPQNMIRKQADALLEYEDKDMPTVGPECTEGVSDVVLGQVLKTNFAWLTKDPFTHESLLIDRKDQKLTKSEKRLAKQGYEMEKKMNISYSRPSYAAFYPKQGGNVRYPTSGGRPVASVRPMMSTPLPLRSQGQGSVLSSLQGGTRLQNSNLKPGVSVQQVRTTADITIPGTGGGPNSGPQKIPAGESVLVIKTPKGVYIRTNQGKIFAVRTALKTTANTTAASGSAVKVISKKDSDKAGEKTSDSKTPSTSVTILSTESRASSSKGGSKQTASIAKQQTSVLKPSISSIGAKASESKAGTAKKTVPVIIKASNASKSSSNATPLTKVDPSKESTAGKATDVPRPTIKAFPIKEPEKKDKAESKAEKKKKKEERKKEKKEVKEDTPNTPTSDILMPPPNPMPPTSSTSDTPPATSQPPASQQPPPPSQALPESQSEASPASTSAAAAAPPPSKSSIPTSLPTPQPFHPPPPQSASQPYMPPYGMGSWGMPPTPSMWPSSEPPAMPPSQPPTYSSPWENPAQQESEPKSSGFSMPSMPQSNPPGPAPSQQYGSMTSLLNSGNPPPPPFQDPFSYSQSMSSFSNPMGGYSSSSYSNPYYPGGYQNSYMPPPAQQQFGAPPVMPPEAGNFGAPMGYGYSNPIAPGYPPGMGSGYPMHMGMMPQYDMGGSGGSMNMGGMPGDPSQGMV